MAEGTKDCPFTKLNATYGFIRLYGALAPPVKPALFFVNACAKPTKSGQKHGVMDSEYAGGDGVSAGEGAAADAVCDNTTMRALHAIAFTQKKQVKEFWQGVRRRRQKKKKRDRSLLQRTWINTQ
jgi:hypothetical protein